MLEDPWAEFKAKSEEESAEKSISDSMIPQYSDSLLDRINPAPDVSEENSELESSKDENIDSIKGDKSISDSLIPMVGDSICERDQSLNDEEKT